MFDVRQMRFGSFALATLTAICAVYLVLAGRAADAGILAVMVAGSLAFLLWQDRLPALFTLLFTAVAALNGAGYAFDLWQRPVWFDEVVHVLTPFVLVSAIAWLLIQRNEAKPAMNRATYFLKVGTLGLLIGFAWEGFEYLIGIIGSRADTASDLVMDTIGAVGAALFCLWAARHPRSDLG
ncbi:hypothetical protein [Croceibacterium aestuarii]|uniref:hypothetical protein n=1 Tax=Croceibacterium aestuarii TaxID=3064139 RepID=UPI00272E1A47|nr:hypothetical protein [Croceibacterium sp. D39]